MTIRMALLPPALLAVVVVLLHAFFGPPLVPDGLRYQVFAEELGDVSALTFAADGSLYATLEKRHGHGQLVQIRGGMVRVLLDNLDKPDGILLRDNYLFITNEAGEHGLARYASGRLRYIDGTQASEGIAAAGPHKLLVVEDRKQHGRLLRIDTRTQEIEVLLDNLHEAEGVCQAADGDIYFVEKTADRLARYSNGQVTTAATGLVNPAFLNCLPDGTVLITEDRTNFGRLLSYAQGELEVLATHLRSPQSVIVGADGAYYLAEQRKNRILRIVDESRNPPGTESS